ncbi:amino acid adenylation domain-containing protein [Streptomyces sp. 5K101]|uniref:hybrid non-ribosomal peptide synthetase/type I polyketide synthase n=1 Tax=Streptomyces sp. 5K101 TaxID=3390037 RepID=UPI0039756FBC
MSDAAERYDDDMPTIAVTGLACRFPGADSAEEFWELLREGVDPREDVPHEDLRRAGRLERALSDPSYVAVRKRFADPSLFDAAYFGMTPAEALVTDPQQRFLLETAVHALEDAGLDPASPPGRTGVYLGVNISDYLLQNVLPHPEAIEPLGFHRVLMGNDRGYTATQLSYRLGLTGPSLAVDCACSSSLAAVHHACRALMEYEADAVLAGGAAINPTDVGYAHVEGGISSPDGHCRPFSADAKGTVFSSGVGLVVLRRLDEALADGDRVLAVIRAGGLNNDGGRKSGYTAPSARGQAELISEVHQLAGITADRVSYVEAHATGTPLGDPIEVSALTQAFRETTDAVGHCAIGSVKSNIGHLDSASGIAGLIKVVLALRHREIPPSLGCERTNPHIDFASSPFRVATGLSAWTGPRPLIAGVSSLGVGGTNVHLLVEEPPAEAAPTAGIAEASPVAGTADAAPVAGTAGASRSTAYLLPFSARSAASLDVLEERLQARVAGSAADDARDVAFTLATRRTTHPLRRGLLWRADGEPMTLNAQAPEPELAERAPAFVLTHDALPTDAVVSLLEHQPAFREAVERLTGRIRAVRPAPSAHETLARLETVAPDAAASVTMLACAAVWEGHGVRPGAVVATAGSRLAAAVLAGVVADADVPAVVSALADGTDLGRALAGVALHPAVIPWYDADGAELCPPGTLPDPAVAFGGRPAVPGRRTLPPRLSALVRLAPVPGLPDALPDVFPEAVPLAVPKDARPGQEALLASLGQAWVTGLSADAAGLAPADDRAAFTDVPRYPFDHRRYWLEPGGAQDTQDAQVRPTGPERATAAGPENADGAAPDASHGDFARTALRIFTDALGTDDVRPDQDLFSLGGDSLLATRIVALARARWLRSIPLGSFLQSPTPARLAELAAQARPGDADGAGRPAGAHLMPHSAVPVADDADGPVPVTAIQEGFLFLSEIEGAAEAYNVPVLADLRGPLDTGALEGALADLVARHETLRTVFRTGSGRPVQTVTAHAPADLPVVDVADESALTAAIASLLATTVPTDRAPLFTARLFRTGPQRHVLALALHHLVADATSSGLLLRDLYAFYNHRHRGDAPALPPVEGLAARHARHEARWLSSAEADRQRAYWHRELADLPAPLELPGDRPRGARRGYRGDKLTFTLPSGTADRVRALAAAESTTPFVVVLTAFSVLLSTLSDQDDIVVGCPVSGRHRPELRGLIGNFVNTLPIRSRIAPDHTFRSLLRDTARRVTGAMDHQDLPFEVVARELAHGGDGENNGSAVFRVLFNMLDPGGLAPVPPAGLEQRPLPFERFTSPYELQLDWWTDAEGRIGGRFVHDTERFARETVADWQESFAFLLDALTRTPDTTVDTVPAEPDATARRTAEVLTGPSVDVPDLPVHAVFLEQAARHPDREAVADDRESLTYRQLARLSAGTADLLASRGVRAGDPVGIAMPRGVPLVVALLGVLRAGATPVVLDLTYPRQRLVSIAAHCGAAVTLCGSAEDADFLPADRVVVVPGPAEAPARDGAAAGDRVDPAVGAYLTYTSGTTGRPKGIHFPHRALANLIHWETDGHATARRWLQLASFGFDAAFHETFAALCSGGSLRIADEETKHDHDALAAFVRRHRVEKAILPVSLMHALAARFEKDPSAFSSLREIATTGEQLRLSEPMRTFFERLDGCRLINNYGPAETHVVTSYTFTGPPRDWPRYAPIGRPLQNVTLRVAGSRGRRAMPRGAVGELVIGGCCVATGYLDEPALTGERFVTSGDGLREYLSGDRTRLLPSGDLAFLGRRDQQVKIRGHRVELGEIEVAVRRSPDIADVALVVRGAEGERRIDAYLVPSPGAGPLVRPTRERLSEELPAALVPATFTVVERLPVNANGKVDHARLPAPDTRDREAGAPEEPREYGDEILSGVLDAFRRVLDQPGLGPADDFFHAGGHSLLATRLIHTVREEFGVRLSVADFYECGTAHRVAGLVADRQALGTAYPDEELPAADPAPALPPGLAGYADRPGADHQKTAVYDTGQRLDPTRLRAAVTELLERQPALRTRVVGTDGTRQARAEEAADAAVTAYRLPAGVAPDDAVAWLYERGQESLIDPRTQHLVRVAALDLPDGHTLLAVSVHLLALDGRGLDNLCRTLGEAYAGPAAHTAPDDGFLRYLAWRGALEADERSTEASALWHDLLAAMPHTGTAAAPVPAAEQARRYWTPDAGLQAALRARCAQQRTTPFTLHVAAFGLALSWLRGEETACPAVPLDGRFQQRFDTTVGAFANIVPVPLRMPSDQPLERLLDGARQVVDQVLSVSAVPYGDLAAAHPRLADFLQSPVVFNYVRDDDDPLRFGTGALRDVGPDPLAPGRRLHLTVVDTKESFRALLRHADDSAGRDEARLLDLYRQALYAMVFEPAATAASLQPYGPHA